MDALLRLVFPAVVRIRDGKIEGPQGALEEQFGVPIASGERPFTEPSAADS